MKNNFKTELQNPRKYGLKTKKKKIIIIKIEYKESNTFRKQKPQTDLGDKTISFA